MAKTPDHMKGVDAIGKSGGGKAAGVHVADPRKQPQNVVAKRKHHKGAIREEDFDSTCLDSGTFDPVNEELTVYFTDGRGPYSYDCSKAEWKELLASPSIGEYFNDELKSD
jgi:KTSC domain